MFLVGRGVDTMHSNNQPLHGSSALTISTTKQVQEAAVDIPRAQKLLRTNTGATKLYLYSLEYPVLGAQLAPCPSVLFCAQEDGTSSWIEMHCDLCGGNIRSDYPAKQFSITGLVGMRVNFTRMNGIRQQRANRRVLELCEQEEVSLSRAHTLLDGREKLKPVRCSLVIRDSCKEKLAQANSNGCELIVGEEPRVRRDESDEGAESAKNVSQGGHAEEYADTINVNDGNDGDRQSTIFNSYCSLEETIAVDERNNDQGDEIYNGESDVEIFAFSESSSDTGSVILPFHPGPTGEEARRSPDIRMRL